MPLTLGTQHEITTFSLWGLINYLASYISALEGVDKKYLLKVVKSAASCSCNLELLNMKVVFKMKKSIPVVLSTNSSASPSIKGEFLCCEL